MEEQIPFQDAQGSLNAKQRGAENLDGAKCQLLANPVDALTVSARMIHRILPSGVTPLKVRDFGSSYGTVEVRWVNICSRFTISLHALFHLIVTLEMFI